MAENLMEVSEAIKKVVWPEMSERKIRKIVINPIPPRNIIAPIITHRNNKKEYSAGYDHYLFSPSALAYTTHVPPGVMVVRSSGQVLGNGVLGRCYKGGNIIEIRDDLYGQDFEEVLRHEVNHVMFPYLGEHEVRSKTRYELPFPAKFH
jgi:hypothetical protein